MIHYEPSKGLNIWEAVKEAQASIPTGLPDRSTESECEFMFNNIKLVVSKYSWVRDIVLIYYLQQDLRKYQNGKTL